MNLFYLADARDTMRLSTDGTIEAAHRCTPHYFLTPEAAYHHPAAEGLTVHAVPTAETIPGARVGADIADAVMAAEVYRAIAAEVRAMCITAA